MRRRGGRLVSAACRSSLRPAPPACHSRQSLATLRSGGGERCHGPAFLATAGALPAPAAAEPPSGEAGGPAEEPAAAEQPPPCKKRKTKGQQQQQPPGAGALAATGIALFSGQQQQQEQKAGAVGAAQEGEQGFTDDTPEVNTHDPFEEANVIRKSHKIKVRPSSGSGYEEFMNE